MSLYVTVKDSEDSVVFDETVESETNGFVGIWLPSDIDGTIVIENDGNTLETPIQTDAESGTCFTDYQFN